MVAEFPLIYLAHLPTYKKLKETIPRTTPPSKIAAILYISISSRGRLDFKPDTYIEVPKLQKRISYLSFINYSNNRWKLTLPLPS